MAESADARVSKTRGLRPVRVRPPLPARCMTCEDDAAWTSTTDPSPRSAATLAATPRREDYGSHESKREDWRCRRRGRGFEGPGHDEPPEGHRVARLRATEDGTRTPHDLLPPMAVEGLRGWRRDQAERRLFLGEAWHDAGVVIDRGDGRPLDPAEFSHAFGRRCARVGLDGVRLHDLRHAFATSLLVAGIHPKVVSEALGTPQQLSRWMSTRMSCPGWESRSLPRSRMHSASLGRLAHRGSGPSVPSTRAATPSTSPWTLRPVRHGACGRR